MYHGAAARARSMWREKGDPLARGKGTRDVEAEPEITVAHVKVPSGHIEIGVGARGVRREEVKRMTGGGDAETDRSGLEVVLDTGDLGDPFTGDRHLRVEPPFAADPDRARAPRVGPVEVV